MQIYRIGTNSIQVNFKANYYTVDKIGKDCNLKTISTDNEENLGKEPVLQYEYMVSASSKCQKEEKMKFNGKYYTAYCSPFTCSYKIYYKDTGKYENNGEKQFINPMSLVKKSMAADRKHSNLPPERPIARGLAEGVVVTDRQSIPKNIPVILITDEILVEDEILKDTPKNVCGVIVSSSDIGTLDHIANLSRNRISSMSIIWDDDKFNDLKKYEGKYIKIDNTDGILKHVEIAPIKLKTKITEKVEVPQLEKVEQFLNFCELTPQNCGNKGYRLSLMQKMAREGKLKNIIIPKGFVIPEGYINKLMEYLDVDSAKRKELIHNGVFTREIEEKINAMEMDKNNSIARSNFNTEDIAGFSSAGIYDSKCLAYYFLQDILDVIKSKDSKLAHSVHKRYAIKDTQIQPSVIIQEHIPSSYNFTLYSDDGDNNILIELCDTISKCYGGAGTLIKFNKKNRTFKIENNPIFKSEYIFDEKENIVSRKYEENKVTKDWKALLPAFEIITSGALVLEKFFRHPQDIEGGIGAYANEGKVFFWQTRDIVAKAVKKI